MTALAWSGCHNARDLGGLPTEDGERLRDHALVRTDSLTRLDEDGRAAVAAYGVARVVDLRTPREHEAAPHPFADAPSYLSVPWVDVDTGQSLAELYRGSLDDNTATVAAAVRGVLDAPPGAVVVHCAAGKDRTGMLVALLLSAVGVPRAEVVADYARSADALGIAEILAGLSPEDRASAERYSWSHPETLTSALDHLEASNGGVTAYLRDACGLTEAELARLRGRLVA